MPAFLREEHKKSLQRENPCRLGHCMERGLVKR